MREIEGLWQDDVRHSGVTVREEMSLPGVHGRLLDLTVTLHTRDTACRLFALQAAKDEHHCILIRCDLDRGELVFDRSRGGSRRDIAHTRRVRAGAKDGELRLRLLMDRESAELFINDGERVLTSVIPTPLSADGVTFSADAPVRMDIEAHHLK